MSQLVINDTPLLINSSLAMKIGLNEAIMLQLVHFWLSKSHQWVRGRKWVCYTYQDWNRQLPFWSVSTIKRSIKELERKGYLISDRFNHIQMDQTKWYSINYQKLAVLEGELGEVQIGPSEGQ
ncbi:hypothetical protein [Bacillus sp. V5-8f]|uniref:hypothetical protein n=1 Tax=Bacillus sp. V5-8f TaxID=2053044 RepID=UPI000C77F67D|nr:hypothetical protein [Bacillus sp. V5-8f]PLT35640.1 hypothetical protein CUU64_03285 [Bacillus sp. V5-8f]